MYASRAIYIVGGKASGTPTSLCPLKSGPRLFSALPLHEAHGSTCSYEWQFARARNLPEAGNPASCWVLPESGVLSATILRNSMPVIVDAGRAEVFSG